MRVEFGGKAIELVQGDITREETDAIVNAANPSLMGGGGVDGAIHRAGGVAILAECQEHRRRLGGPLPEGEAVITTGGRLRARHVIHTAGPVWEGGSRGEADVLARCYRSALRLADEHGLESLAFPSISTGIFGYPVDRAAPVALGAVREALAEARHVRLARFVLFDGATFAAYREALAAPG
jgi:O-acetyl-ADP-ribose deacetylase (regulator of RNase III)